MTCVAKSAINGAQVAALKPSWRDGGVAHLDAARLGQGEIGPAFGQISSHLGPHEDGKRPGRDQEVIAGGMPVATVIGYAATGNEAVYMRMVDDIGALAHNAPQRP